MMRGKSLRSRESPDYTLSCHDQITRALGMDILSGRIKVSGTIPPESALRARFGVSRTVLREAIKTLAAKGLLESKTRMGTRVLPPLCWNMFDADVLSWRLALGNDATIRHDIAEIRLGLEPRAAALAAQRRTRYDLVELRTWISQMRRPGHTRRSYAEVDLGFHLAVGNASANALMRSIASVIETALLQFHRWSSVVDSPELLDEGIAAREAIVNAIEAQDSEAAAAAMQKVISVENASVEKAYVGRANAMALHRRDKRK
jgi:DNA-binding FadR family transcriptional regulator